MSDQERLDRLSAKAQQKAAEEARKLEEKVGGLRSQIERFLDEKGAIQRSPMTISETLKSAQKILAQRKQEFFVEGLLAQELKALQNQYSFLEPAAMRIHLLGDLHMFRWVFSNWITELDLLEASKFLSDENAIDEKERVRRIAAIDEKVRKLENEIEKLLS